MSPNLNLVALEGDAGSAGRDEGGSMVVAFLQRILLSHSGKALLEELSSWGPT